jgi:hypothetical protein
MMPYTRNQLFNNAMQPGETREDYKARRKLHRLLIYTADIDFLLSLCAVGEWF